MSLLAGGPGRLAGGPGRLDGGGWAAWLEPAAEEEAFRRSAALAACRLEQVQHVDLSECDVDTECEFGTECADCSDLEAQLAQAQELCDALAVECMELRALAWRLRGGHRGKPNDELVVDGGCEVYDGVETPEVPFTEVGLVECDGVLDGEGFGERQGSALDVDGSGCKAQLAQESIVECDGDSFDSWRAGWSSRRLLTRRMLLVRPCWARGSRPRRVSATSIAS